MNTSTQTRPRVAVLPEPVPHITAAIVAGGGSVVGLGESPDAVVVAKPYPQDTLRDVLSEHPSVRWVQLPSAGIERFVGAVAAHRDLTWTCAKGLFAPPIAEHVVGAAIALLRRFPERARATGWGPRGGRTLAGLDVLVVGGGGIGSEVSRLFALLGTTVTVLRRNDLPVPGAARVVTGDRLSDLLPAADIVVLAAALTPDTEHLIGSDELALMKPDAFLINVARGKLLDTDALVAALRDDRIGGAALDVTDPEPLPDGHPLWADARCLITPHASDTGHMPTLVAGLIERNVRRRGEGRPLEGPVDPAAGY